jgi:hypothetical protein
MIEHDITKCTMDDVYDQQLHAQLLTIHITFATRSCFCNWFDNYQISTHFSCLKLGKVWNNDFICWKIHAIKFQWLMMVPFGNT